MIKYDIVNSRYRRFSQHFVFHKLIQIVLFIFRERLSCFSVLHWKSIFIVHFLTISFKLKDVGFLFPFLHPVVTISTNKTDIILSRWRPLWLVVFFLFFWGRGGAIRWPVSSSSLQVKQRLVLLVCVDFVDQWGYKIPTP